MSRHGSWVILLASVVLAWSFPRGAEAGPGGGLTIEVQAQGEGGSADPRARVVVDLINHRILEAHCGYDLLAAPPPGPMGDAEAQGIYFTDVRVTATLSRQGQAPQKLRLRAVELASGVEIAAIEKVDDRPANKPGLGMRILGHLVDRATAELIPALKAHLTLVTEQGLPLRIEFLSPPDGAADALSALLKQHCLLLSKGALTQGGAYAQARCKRDSLEVFAQIAELIEKRFGAAPYRVQAKLRTLIRLEFETPKAKKPVGGKASKKRRR